MEMRARTIFTYGVSGTPPWDTTESHEQERASVLMDHRCVCGHLLFVHDDEDRECPATGCPCVRPRWDGRAHLVVSPLPVTNRKRPPQDS
jgi:hypothetical protein